MKRNSIQKGIRNILITFFALSGVSSLYRKKYREPLVRIVVFHNIADAAWFESMIRVLTTDFHVVTPEEFVSKKFNNTKINILITFDDGYASWISEALPILKKYNAQALFFINSGLVDVSLNDEETAVYMKKRLHLFPKKALTWEGVRMLVKEGHMIGGHTRTHAHLGKASPKKTRREIDEDKKVIEAQIGKKITEFAYPFGTRRHVTELAKQEVQALGYSRGYTAISRFVSGDLYATPRMCIESGLSPRMLRWWVLGAYDLFDIVKSICAR